MNQSLSPTSSTTSAARKTTALYYLSFICLGLTTASLGPTLDALAAQTSSGIDQISWVFTVRALGYLLGALAAGRLFDRLRGHPLMAAALLLIAAGMVLVPEAALLWLLMLLLLAVGLGEGLLDVGGNTLIVWLHGRAVGPFMNGLHFCFGLGALIAPLVVALVLARTGGIGWVYGLIAFSILPAALCLSRNGSPPIRNQQGGGESYAGSPGPGLVALLVLFFVFYVGAEVSFGGWIYLYAVTAAQAPAQTAAFITSAFWAAFTLGRLLSIPIAARLSPKRILQIDFLGAFAALAILFFWPAKSWAIWTAAIVFGASIASVFPTMITFAGTRIPITARVTAFFFLGATLGGMLLPWLVGQFFEAVGPGFLVHSLALDLLLAVLVLLGLNIAFRRVPTGPTPA